MLIQEKLWSYNYYWESPEWQKSSGVWSCFLEENEGKGVKEAKYFSTATSKKQNDTGEKEEVFIFSFQRKKYVD